MSKSISPPDGLGLTVPAVNFFQNTPIFPMPHQLPPFGVSNSSNVVENCIGSRVRVLVNEDDSFTYKATVLVTDDFETTVLLDPLDDFQSNTLFGNSFNDLVQEGNHAIFENDEVRVHRVYPLATPLKNDECKYGSALPPPLPTSNLDMYIADQSSSTSPAKYKRLADLLFTSSSHPKTPDLLSALELYHLALTTSNKISVGSTCLTNRNGFVSICEIDAIEGRNVDVVYLDDDDETTIKMSSILLPLPPQKFQTEQEFDAKLATQQSILYNAARSLTRLSKGKFPLISTSQRFVLSAIHCVSLGLGVVDYRRRRRRMDSGEEEQKEGNSEGDLDVAEATGRHIRGTLFLEKGDFQRASLEVKLGLKLNFLNEKGEKNLFSLKEKIRGRKERSHLVDKQLAKGIAKLVDHSMKKGVGNAQMSRIAF